ncbi:hypothetical protein ENUP19_0223G0007 [Entamoeba nuttalli]|uniref:GTPase-activator protein for Ras family GTPase n=1 Tax=Entamoeba nuttalli TaxID=412467 RepID=A0ABQ0DPU0_9EUKA
MSSKQLPKPKSPRAIPSLIMDKRKSIKYYSSTNSTPRSRCSPRNSINTITISPQNELKSFNRNPHSSPKLLSSQNSKRKSIISPQLLTIEKESQSLTNSIKEMIGIGINRNNDETDIWEKMLLSCDVGITSAVIQYIERQELTQDEKEINSIMLFNFFNEHNKLTELINFCIERDIYLKYDDLNTYSPYVTLYKCMLGYTQKYYFSQFSAFYQKKATKMKDTSLDDCQSSKTVKNMVAFKSILEDIVSLMTDDSIVPIYIKYTWSTIYKLLYKTNPDIVMKYMYLNMFLIPFNDIIEELMKVISSQHLNTLLNVSKCFHEIISPSNKTLPCPFWKEWIATKCIDLKTKLNNYIIQISKFYCDESDVIMDLPQNLVIPLIDYLKTDWESLYGYLSDEGYRMIELRMTSQLEMKQRVLSLVHQINQLRVSTFNENQMYLQKMSEMKMRMKDLQEERRYLRQILYPEESETISIEEDKDLSTHS